MHIPSTYRRRSKASCISSIWRSAHSALSRAWRRNFRGGQPPLRQEGTNAVRDFLRVRLQREMTGVKELHQGVRIIALERFGAGRNKEWVVLAPDREERRRVLAEIVLEGRIERDVALVVAEQVELHIVRARARKVEIVEVLAVR